MTGKFFKRPLKRGMKFLIAAVVLLLGLYAIAYVVVLWFLSSTKGQEWIEQTVTSRLGISARWEGASVSPLLEPSLTGVSVELKTGEDQPPQKVTLGEVIVKWPLFGSQEVRVQNIQAPPGLVEGLDGRIEQADVAWAELDGKGKRLSLEVDEPVITIAEAGKQEAAPGAVAFVLDDLRKILSTANGFADTVLGSLSIDNGRVVVAALGDKGEFRDISLSRVGATGPLQLKGEAKGPGNSEFSLEASLEGTTPSDVSGRTSISASDLRWAPGVPGWLPKEFLGPTVIEARVPSRGPLGLSVNMTETGGTLNAGISSLSPVSATGALKMKDIAFDDASLGVTGRVQQINGDMNIAGLKQGRLNLDAEVESFSYKAEDLQFDAPSVSLTAQGDLHTEEGLRNGRVDVSVSPSRLNSGETTFELPTVTMGVQGLRGTLDGEVEAKQLEANVGDLARFTGSFSGRTTPSTKITGSLNSKGMSLKQLTEFLDTVPVSGQLDMENQFDLSEETKQLQTKAQIANLRIPQATMQIAQLQLDTRATLEKDGALNGTLEGVAKNPQWEDISLSALNFSAQIARRTPESPIEISSIEASCPLFSATGEAEAVTDDKGIQTVTYDLTIRFSDLSETYQELTKILEKLRLEGIDIGGRASVRITGSWLRERNWQASAVLDLFKNYAFSGEREIPVQWEGLDATVEAEVSRTAAQDIRGHFRLNLADFLALASLYEFNAVGREYVFEGDIEYNPADRSVAVSSASLNAPGGLTCSGEAGWSPETYRVNTVASATDLQAVHQEVLRSVLVSGWPISASLTVGGGFQGELSVTGESETITGHSGIRITDGTAEWGRDSIQGLEARLSAGVQVPATGLPRLEPREDMKISANQIWWGGDEIHNVAIHPRIRDGDILWDDNVFIPIPGGRIELGPVAIRDPMASDRLIRSSLRLNRITAERNDAYLPSASVLAAFLPELTFSRNVLTATGEMTIHIFDGQATLSGIKVLEFFSSYPVWAGNMVFESLDLARVCDWLDFGRMEGKISGSIRDLELSMGDEIRPLSFELDVESEPGGGMISRQAIKMLVDLGQQASTRLLMDRAVYAYGRLGLRARLEDDRFFLWGKFKEGDKYYFVQPPDPMKKVLSLLYLDFEKLNTVKIALNSPERELSFKDVWNRLEAMSQKGFEEPEIRVSLFRRLNPFTAMPF